MVDHVPECRDAGGWDGVTFENLLDMATGRYDSAETDADENVANTSRFFLSTTHAEKIRISCTIYPRKDPPGKRWVYHTSDTYILGAALTSWWRKEKGPAADFFRDLLVEPVYNRLGLSPEIATSRRTADEVSQPFTGWGLVLRRDDIVKLGGFLAAGEAKPGAESLLDPAMMRASLQRDAVDTGLPARDGNFRYNDGVYAWNIAGELRLPGAGVDSVHGRLRRNRRRDVPERDRVLLRERRWRVPLDARGCRGEPPPTPLQLAEHAFVRAVRLDAVQNP